MKCPFCKQPIPGDQLPLVHMSACMHDETKRFEAWLNNPVRAQVMNGHRAGCMCADCYKPVGASR